MKYWAKLPCKALRWRNINQYSGWLFPLALYHTATQLNLTNTCFANQGLSGLGLRPASSAMLKDRIEDIADGSYTISLALGKSM